jgi:glycosyltransferase involved in cell wall biosynthesis
MVRVLHLANLETDFQSGRGMLHLTRDLGPGYESAIRTIGHGGSFRHLADAVLGMRRLRAQPFDLIHAWGAQALTAAALSGWGKIVYSPQPQTTAKSIRWLNSILAYKKFDTICTTATQHRMCVERGVPGSKAHLIRPGVDFSRLRRRRSPELRAELGFADSDFVLLAIGESTQAAAHRTAIWATGILNVLDHTARITAWGRGDGAHSTNRFAERLVQNGLFTPAEQKLGRAIEFEEMTTVADAAITTPRGAIATLPISICMAAALPIVSTVTYTVAELLEDRHNCLMVTTASPRAIAERILDLRQDADLRWRITDTARTEAYEFFSLTRFLDQWRAVYQQVAAGNAIEVPEPANMRSHAHG